MKTILNKIAAIAILSVTISACKQEVITLQPPQKTTPDASQGSADFSKYVSIGNSLTAGFQAGALFDEGQQNSFPLILSKQFSIAKDPTGTTTLTFNQPDINSVNGYNSSASASAGFPVGRYILFAADGNPNDALPTPTNPGLPAPYNTAGPAFTDLLFYNISFDKSKLNNFGVPGILLVQCLIGATGGPSTNNPAFNPYYARFASNPGTSSIIGDAIAAQPTFFTFDLGNNDVLGYATSGGWHGAGSIRLTPSANFNAYYDQAIGALMTNTPATTKGVIATIPDVTSIPFFVTIEWNAIPLDAATAAYVKTNLADNYNAFLAGMKANSIIDAAELAKRTLGYQAGQNAILITDETLTDLSPYMAGPYAGLLPYAKARQTTFEDLIPLTAAAKLGTLANPNDPSTVYGVAVPMADNYILIKQEIDSIKTAVTAYNTHIASVATTYSDRIAVADVNAALAAMALYGGYYDANSGVTITPDFKPPFGAFSADGVHPNSRGYAFMANIFIGAINAKFGAKVPPASLADYRPALLPIVP